jgi:hypothetical protein
LFARWLFTPRVTPLWRPVPAAATVNRLRDKPGQPARDMEDDAMRRFLLIGGLALLVVGLLWIGQGTGTIAWPRTSFMINQLQWAGYGTGVAALGLVMIWQGSNG